MSEDVLKFAFEPGFSTRREVGGLGVGLSVSREIIEALGGSIAIASQPGIGTRVTLRVPLCRG
jgi:signal transduction histidine kinase